MSIIALVSSILHLEKNLKHLGFTYKTELPLEF